MDSLLADYSSDSSSEDEREAPEIKEITLPTKKTQTIDINVFKSPFSKPSTTGKDDDNNDDDDDDGPTDEAKALRARDAAAGKRDISHISSFSDLLPPPKNPAGTLRGTKRKMMAVPVKFRKSAAGPRATPWDSASGADPKRAKIYEDCAFAVANAPVPDFGDDDNDNDNNTKNSNGAREVRARYEGTGAGGNRDTQRDDGTLWDYARPAQRSTSAYVYSTSDAGVREKELERAEHTTEETALDLSSDYLRSIRTEEEEMLQNNPAFVQTIAAPTFHLGSQSRRKHQLKYLAVDAYYKEQSLAIKRANGKKSKAQTQSKYGW